MISLLGFGRSKSAKVDQPRAEDAPVAVAIPAKDADKQLEMIRLAISGVLRRHGIASHWIGCELQPMNRAGTSDAMLVQLVVRKWHDGLMHYAPELQREFFDEIRLFDQNASSANLLIVWKFSADCGYPNGKLPAPEFWASGGAAVPVAVAAAVAPGPKKFDLPPSSLDETGGDDDSGFAPTQIHGDQ